MNAPVKTPLNGTFWAFKARSGGTLLPATLLCVFAWIVLLAAFVIVNVSGLRDYAAWYAEVFSAQAAGAPPPMPPTSVLGMAPSYLILLALMYILFAAYEAGAHRWMIRGEREGLFNLSLGADTWRVYAGYWVWLAVFIGLYLALILFSLGVGVVGALLAKALPIVGGLFGLVGALVAIGGFLYVLIRLSPASAASVALRRFAFFEAWKVSEGRFWALFGAWALWILLYIAAYFAFVIAALLILFGPAAFSDPNVMQNLPQQFSDPAFWGPRAAPLAIAYAGMMAFAFVMILGLFGINARAASVALEEGKIR